MLQHVSLEVPAPEGDAFVEFCGLLGFEPIEAPPEIADYVRWVERSGTHIHVILTDPAAAAVPQLGHCAVVVDDFAATLERLRSAGHDVAEARELWGARRAFAMAPGGHRVELMASPPS
ncbi:MAG TPA: VOC family protein [Solirubrobacterales bacterium]|nr:VOC family protein [Solirubrobacterales bacterium]